MATSLSRREPIELPQSPEIINVDELDTPVIPRFRHTRTGMGDATSSRSTARRTMNGHTHPPPHEIITLSDDDSDGSVVGSDDEITVLPNPVEPTEEVWSPRPRCNFFLPWAYIF